LPHSGHAVSAALAGFGAGGAARVGRRVPAPSVMRPSASAGGASARVNRRGDETPAVRLSVPRPLDAPLPDFGRLEAAAGGSCRFNGVTAAVWACATVSAKGE
jgi:hypothetical protein